MWGQTGKLQLRETGNGEIEMQCAEVGCEERVWDKLVPIRYNGLTLSVVLCEKHRN